MFNPLTWSIIKQCSSVLEEDSSLSAASGMLFCLYLNDKLAKLGRVARCSQLIADFKCQISPDVSQDESTNTDKPRGM